MNGTSVYNFTTYFEELQSRLQSMTSCLQNTAINALLNDDASSEFLKQVELFKSLNPNMVCLNDLPVSKILSFSSKYFNRYSENALNEESISDVYSDGCGVSSNQRVLRPSKDSTSSIDINQINDEFYLSLTKRTTAFVWMLKHTDFEDGVENDVIKEVEGYIRMNRFVTYSWLHTIYSNNQKDADVLAGLLRIIGMTVEKENADKLLPMVKAGLSDPQSKAQEAALMVIEEWRTPNCLTAIETATNLYSGWIRDYAEQIKTELKKELQSC